MCNEQERAAAFTRLLHGVIEHLSPADAPFARVDLARVLYLRGDLQEAADLAEAAFNAVSTAGGPRGPGALSTRLVRAGQAALALTCVSVEDRDNQLPVAEMAISLAEVGERRRAMEIAVAVLDATVPSSPDDVWHPWIISRAVTALAQAGAPEMALPHVASIGAHRGHKASALLAIAEAFNKSGKLSAAHDAARQALTVTSEAGDGKLASKQAQVAALLWRIGRSAESRTALEQALRIAQVTSLEVFLDTLASGATALIGLAGASVADDVLRALERATEGAQSKVA